MKRRYFSTVLAAMLVSLITTVSVSSVNLSLMISYQGMLQDGQGNLIKGMVR